eukprot:CAMPEP_0174706706 /NCGR_PEP_ID=MMETSP1094-20130205/9455_1 /TAXON_ID=156173 /ORGANISM="Chrysochromulina brevifilum, Strain UTEX LB 985" /LENGTH=212 /DNA_ID=CAMNT_0015905009 /DNA_START=373 /DNA_END=1012 /DNA_ORIENTATION=-
MAALNLVHLQAASMHQAEDVSIPVAAPSHHMTVETMLLPPSHKRPVTQAMLKQQDLTIRLAAPTHLAQRRCWLFKAAKAERVDDAVERRVGKFGHMARVCDGECDARWRAHAPMFLARLRHLTRSHLQHRLTVIGNEEAVDLLTVEREIAACPASYLYTRPRAHDAIALRISRMPDVASSCSISLSYFGARLLNVQHRWLQLGSDGTGRKSS